MQFKTVLEQLHQPALQFDSQLPNSQNPTSAVGEHYWKTGYYRSITPGITNLLWIGPVVRATSLEEVETIAFEPRKK